LIDDKENAMSCRNVKQMRQTSNDFRNAIERNL